MANLQGLNWCRKGKRDGGFLLAGFRVNNNKIVLKISPQEQEQSLLIVFINCIETQAKSKKNSDGFSYQQKRLSIERESTSPQDPFTISYWQTPAGDWNGFQVSRFFSGPVPRIQINATPTSEHNDKRTGEHCISSSLCRSANRFRAAIYHRRGKCNLCLLPSLFHEFCSICR